MFFFLVALSAAAAAAAPCSLDIHFRTLNNSEAGIAYARQPSDWREDGDPHTRMSVRQALEDGVFFNVDTQLIDIAMVTKGMPGVLVFDVDGDGDDDFYVPQGPRQPNHLYVNQWVPEGRVHFVESAAAYNLELTAFDGNGACAADADNDGDWDVAVMGNTGHEVFENIGNNGTFVRRSLSSGLKRMTRGRLARSCAWADVTGDGWPDLLVAHIDDTNDARSFHACVQPDISAGRNSLFRATAPFAFVDDSAASHFDRTVNTNATNPGAAFTWAVVPVDIDLDGDIDVVTFDDQCQTAEPGFAPIASCPHTCRSYRSGLIHVYYNDGHGRFTPVNVVEDNAGSWMAGTVRDLNGDGRLDILSSNTGNYMYSWFPQPLHPDRYERMWLLQRADGTFEDSGVGPLINETPFHWGLHAADWDRDGDEDIIGHGGIDLTLTYDCTNAGAAFVNDGSARAFCIDRHVFDARAQHQRRSVNGVAMADFNQDGWMDVVTVSNRNYPRPRTLVTSPYVSSRGPSPFDEQDLFFPIFFPVTTGDNPALFAFGGDTGVPGDVIVDLAVPNSDHVRRRRQVVVRTVGARGILPPAFYERWLVPSVSPSPQQQQPLGAPRDGIGAIVQVYNPVTGRLHTIPMEGGGNTGSQSAPRVYVGTPGGATAVDVSVQWPGRTGPPDVRYDSFMGVRTTRTGHVFVAPQLPCANRQRRCVDAALDLYVHAGALTVAEADAVRRTATGNSFGPHQ